MAKRTKKSRWSYAAGERGRNRVLAFEHESGLLMLQFKKQGRRKRISLGHRERERAKRQAEEAAARLGRAETLRPEELTLGELFDMYVRERTPDKALTTQKHDRAAARLFIKAFGAAARPRALHRGDWDRFTRERTSGKAGTRKVGPRTVARDLKWILAVFNWATQTGDGKGGVLLERNPFKGFPIPREESPRRETLTQERYQAMLGVAEEVDWRFAVALVLARETGHRIGAVRCLRWSDVDLCSAEVCWRGEHDKIGLEHHTPLSPEALSALERARKANPAVGDAWVLPAPRAPSQPVRKDLMTSWWKRAERLADLEPVRWLGWHSLRRMFANERKNVSLRLLSDLGGWKEPSTIVKCYQRSSMDEMRAALNAPRKTG